MSLESISDEIRSLEMERSVLIAIDGFGGAGKTTVAENLAQLLGSARIVHMDDHLIDKTINNTPELLGFDRPGITKIILRPVIEREETREEDFIIVEGISALHPDFRDNFDYGIWVDTPIVESTRRAVARDQGKGHEHLRDMWIKNDLAYYAIHKPSESADAVISNS